MTKKKENYTEIGTRLLSLTTIAIAIARLSDTQSKVIPLHNVGKFSLRTIFSLSVCRNSAAKCCMRTRCCCMCSHVAVFKLV